MDPHTKSLINVEVTNKYTVQDSHLNVFAAKFSPDGRFYASSYADGTVHIHNAQAPKGDKISSFKLDAPGMVYSEEAEESKARKPHQFKEGSSDHFDSEHAVTRFAWKPSHGILGKPEFQLPQSFKAVTSDGRILKWKSENPSDLQTIYTSESNYYHCIDYSHDGGQKIACAGNLPIIEIFDEETMARVHFFE